MTPYGLCLAAGSCDQCSARHVKRRLYVPIPRHTSPCQCGGQVSYKPINWSAYVHWMRQSATRYVEVTR